MSAPDRLATWRRGPLLGAAYYNEYLPDPSRLETDLSLMKDAGIACIRVGESVWSTWEPRDGEFDLEWLTPILDAAAAHGIHVILGTPTYAVPPWLARKHPELAVVRKDGTSVSWGGRQEVDYTSTLFRGYAERVIRAVLGRHGRHPAVVGIQLDNEAGLHLIHNDHVVAQFRQWLAARYGDVDTLNREWGLAYWSHRVSDWDDLWAPAGNTTPAYDLAWRRFQAELTADFIGWQAHLAREHVADETFLTTCIAYQRPAMDDVAVGARVDIASGNAYYLAQDALDFSADGAGDQWYADDVPQFILMADRMRATDLERPGSRGGFLVSETGAASIGNAWLTRPPYDGQLAQAAWLLVARGARLISYWHWHTLHSGHEVHWGGVLGHDLEPGRIYGEVAEIGRQFALAAEHVADAEPDAEVGILYAHDSEWMMAFEPPLAMPGSDAPDRKAYGRIVGNFGRGAVDAGLQVGYVNERQLPSAADLLARFPVVIAAGLIAAPDRTLAVLAEYAQLGGRLIVGPRTGYADDQGRMRAGAAPAVLGEMAGVRYQEHAALAVPVEVEAEGPSRLGAHRGWAQGWVDALTPSAPDVETLLHYRHPHFGRWAAATCRAVGRGSITVVGTLLDRPTMRAIVADAARDVAAVSSPIVERPACVTVHSLNGPHGRVWVVHNWSPEDRSVRLTCAVASITDAEAYAAGDTVMLRAWGVEVWRVDGEGGRAVSAPVDDERSVQP